MYRDVHRHIGYISHIFGHLVRKIKVVAEALEASTDSSAHIFGRFDTIFDIRQKSLNDRRATTSDISPTFRTSRAIY